MEPPDTCFSWGTQPKDILPRDRTRHIFSAKWECGEVNGLTPCQNDAIWEWLCPWSCWYKAIHSEDHGPTGKSIYAVGEGKAAVGMLGKAVASENWVWDTHTPINSLMQRLNLCSSARLCARCWGNDSKQSRHCPGCQRAHSLEFS